MHAKSCLSINVHGEFCRGFMGHSKVGDDRYIYFLSVSLLYRLIHKSMPFKRPSIHSISENGMDLWVSLYKSGRRPEINLSVHPLIWMTHRVLAGFPMQGMERQILAQSFNLWIKGGEEKQMFPVVSVGWISCSPGNIGSKIGNC